MVVLSLTSINDDSRAGEQLRSSPELIPLGQFPRRVSVSDLVHLIRESPP
jgi:hypothetical protein